MSAGDDCCATWIMTAKSRRTYAVAAAVVGLAMALALVLLTTCSSRREVLFERVDSFTELRRACRRLARMPEWRRAEGERRRHIITQGDPEYENVPEEIRALRPHGVVIDDTFVKVEMGGAWFHYGFFVELTDEETVPAVFENVRVDAFEEIVPGVYYYEQHGI